MIPLGDALFITDNLTPYDWRMPLNNNLWQGESGINNPCPQGYRLPNETEMTALFSAESIICGITVASSSLAFSSPGTRSYFNAMVSSVGTTGNY